MGGAGEFAYDGSIIIYDTNFLSGLLCRFLRGRKFMLRFQLNYSAKKVICLLGSKTLLLLFIEKNRKQNINQLWQISSSM